MEFGDIMKLQGEFQTLKMQILTQSSTYDLSVAIVGTTLFIIIIGIDVPYEFLGDKLITEIAFEDTITQGDVNQDNTLNILDIITVVGFIMGTEEFSNEQIFIGDLNEDGFVDILDIVAMVNTILLD